MEAQLPVVMREVEEIVDQPHERSADAIMPPAEAMRAGPGASRRAARCCRRERLLARGQVSQETVVHAVGGEQGFGAAPISASSG